MNQDQLAKGVRSRNDSGIDLVGGPPAEVGVDLTFETGESRCVWRERFNHDGNIGVTRRVQFAASCGPVTGRVSYRTSEVVPNDRKAGLVQEFASGCVDRVLAWFQPAARREPQPLSAIAVDCLAEFLRL
jgi:hypothetical protein